MTAVMNIKGRNIPEVKSLFKAGEHVYIGDVMGWKWGLKRSKWYNPYHKLLKQGYTRDQVLLMYKESLLKNEQLLNDLPELEGKILCCWCNPLRCHGDILIEVLEGDNK